ncbi:MAG: MerR family transcriptional regulator [Solirubrobacteraceae bacterium]
MAEELTIDALARETGMTVRNIRAHATRGLLPPPEVRARTGYYGPDHVARLKLILELQAAGHNPTGIKHLLSRTESATAEDVLGFARSLLAPYESETPEVVEEQELRERFGDFGAKLQAKAVKLGLVVPLGEGRFEVPSPALLRAGDALLELGVPLERVLSMLESVSRSTDSIAEQFVKLFMERIFNDAELPDVGEALDRLRPLATEAVVALFHQRMSRRTERAFSRALEKK